MVSLGMFGPKYPYSLIKFSSTPNWKGLPLCSSSSSSSMEFPPEGYRRGVGICLINSSGKVGTLRSPSSFYVFLFPSDDDNLSLSN